MSTSPARIVAVVEDDEDMRQAIRRVLEAEGFVIEAFGSAEAFLASEAPTRARSLVLDIQLPGISGIELHDSLRSVGNSVPIVFVTAHDDLPLSRRAMKRSECFLLKPFPGEMLIQAVTRSIAAR